MISLDIDQLAKIATEEVLSPTLDLTKQYLEVNQVLYENGIPVISEIILKEEEDSNFAVVYFPIVDESYYFVVYLDLNPDILVRQVAISAGNTVKIYVSSESHSADELINLLGMNPDQKWSKGDKRQRRGYYDFSGLIYEPNGKKTGEVEDKLRNLIKLFNPYKENLVHLTKVASVVVSVAYYGYKDEMLGIHLDTEIISKLAEFHLPIDIDLYASGPDLNYDI